MHVLIIGPFTSGYGYFSAGKELGMEVSVITTNKGDYAIPEAEQGSIDRLIEVTDFEINTLIGAAMQLHKAHPINGILPGFEFIVEPTVHVADALGLPSIDVKKVGNVRNKMLMRQALQDAGVRAPRFARATNAVDVEQVADTVGFPAVIKPTERFGSAGVTRVDNKIELLAAYEDIVGDNDAWGDTVGAEVVIEELLEGLEFNVDGFVSLDGEITVHEFGQYELGPQPHFQVLGITMRRADDLPEASALSAYIKDVVRAVGITVGPFHGEVILTKDGPVLVEIGNRLPGAYMPALSECITGISFAKCALATVMNIPIPAPTEPKARVAAFRCITPPSELLGKTYESLSGWDELAKDAHVDHLTVFIKPGETIPQYADERSWIAEVRYHADSAEEAEAFRKKILEMVHVA